MDGVWRLPIYRHQGLFGSGLDYARGIGQIWLGRSLEPAITVVYTSTASR